MKSVFIGFDFSMNKPACTLLYDKKFYFFIWPSKLDSKKIKLYQDAGVYVVSRELEPISTAKSQNSELVLEHTIRSAELAKMIVNDLDKFLTSINVDSSVPLYIASEGLAFSSKGDATLNLASYKGVLLAKLYEHFYGRLHGLHTYPPITIKSVAGCATKNKMKLKSPMITAFLNESLQGVPFFNDMLAGKFINKTNYINCVDDIVDSYWVLKTMLIKCGLIK